MQKYFNMKTAFVDESGDTGLKIGQGSSPYFILGIVSFEDKEQLKVADKAISNLKKEMGLPISFEFKFSHSSDKIKIAFLTLLKKLDFQFCGIVINKRVHRISSRTKMYALALHLGLKQTEITNDLTRIHIDNFFRKGEIHKVEKAILPIARMKGMRRIKIYQKDSAKDNLIQLADFVAGVINRLFNHHKDGEKYYEYIQNKQDIIIFK